MDRETSGILRAYIRGRTADEMSREYGKSVDDIMNVVEGWKNRLSKGESGLELLESKGVLQGVTGMISTRGKELLGDSSISLDADLSRNNIANTRGKSFRPVSFYLPPDALQGQNIPAHLIWVGHDWTRLTVLTGLGLRFENVFNSKSFHPEKRGRVRRIVVSPSDLKRPGYLGMRLSSSVSRKSTKIEAKVRVRVFDGPREVWQEAKSLRLFRPAVTLAKIPVKVQVSGNQVSGKIGLSISGQGTILMLVDSTKESEAELRVPRSIEQSFKELGNEMDNALKAASVEYPQYEPFFTELRNLEIKKANDWNTFQQNLKDKIENDPEFNKTITSIFTVVWSRSSLLQQEILQPIADFAASTQSRVIFANPFAVVVPTRKPKTLILKIQAFTLLEDIIARIETPPIRLEAVSGKAPVPISRLLEIAEVE